MFSHIQNTKIFFLILIIITSCFDNNHRYIDIFKLPKKYADIKTIACASDSSITYDVYIPVTYNSKIKYPVVFFFDAHARGRMAVDSLKQGAEVIGCIIVASNNFYNGVANSGYIFETLVNDVKQRYTIDDNSIYLGGFSGGARFAAMIARTISEIKGIICCGAGLSIQPNTPISLNGCYYAMVGNSDFNFSEMGYTNSCLNNTNVQHCLHIFNGGHEYPSQSNFTKALIWCIVNNINKANATMNNDLIYSIKKQFADSVNYYKSINQTIKAYELVLYAINYFKGICEVDEFIKMQNSFESLSEIKNYNAVFKHIYSIEPTILNQYYSLIQTTSVNSVAHEIDAIDAKMINEPNIQNYYFMNRIKNYCSMLVYMKINDALINKNYDKVTAYLKLYKKINPNNPDFFYLKSKYFKLILNNDSAKIYLNRAIDMGFNNFVELNNDTLLRGILVAK